jgi:hypothetical protein
MNVRSSSMFGVAQRRALESRLTEEAAVLLGTGAGWDNWLRVRRHFPQEPLSNQWLISAQRPYATSLATYVGWRRLGYAVRKGEKAIRIWAVRRGPTSVLDRLPVADAEVDDGPTPILRLTPVFDRSQVVSVVGVCDEPGVPFSSCRSGDRGRLADCFESLRELGRSVGLTIEIEAISGRACGYHEPATGRVVIERIRPGFSVDSQLSVLVGEISQALVGVDQEEEDPKLDHVSGQVLAESVTVAVCAGRGLAGEGRLLIQHDDWFARGEREPAEHYAVLVDRLARRIEEVLRPPAAGTAGCSAGDSWQTVPAGPSELESLSLVEVQ